MSSPKTKAEMRAIFDAVSNWGVWGKQDERGTLNYLTPARVAAAGRLIKSGQQISCARNFPVIPGPENPTPALHHIVMGGDDPCGHGVPGLEVSLDFIGIAYHGLASSHIDALCHVFVEGKMYNGFPATDVRSTGARHNSIMSAKDGIVGRCVLLDIPRLRGKPFVALDRPVTIDELDAAEKAQGVTVGEGDILLVAVGRDAQKQHEPHKPGEEYSMPGLDPNCIPWLHKKKIAVLGSDAVHDPSPPVHMIEDWRIPVHMCALAGMGLHLLDNLRLVELENACAAEKRWEFFFATSPLRIERGTGSPANPIAIL
jgi:kynurenine formamidase